MKRKMLVVMIVALTVGALMISCNSEVGTNSGSDSLAKVSVSLGSDSKDITATPSSSITPVEQLNWYYVATKTDSGLYATGATTWRAVPTSGGTASDGQQMVEGRLLNRFSTGSWSFSFYGYKTAQDSAPESPASTAVYYAENIAVTVDGDTSVNVQLQTGALDLAKVKFDSVQFKTTGLNINSDANGNFTLQISGLGATPITSDSVAYASTTSEYTFKFDSQTSKTVENLAAGDYTVTFQVLFGGVVVAEEAKNITVSAGTIITFSGDVLSTDPTHNVVIGNITSTTTAKASVNADPVNAITIQNSITPVSSTATTAANVTTVSFPAESLATESSAETAVVLEMTVYDTAAAAANSSFTVNSSSASAALDLVLTVGDESVTSFNGKYVAVSTYIATGLENVTVGTTGTAVVFNSANTTPDASLCLSDESTTGTGYNPLTGLLVFKTNHFSSFYVNSSNEAVNITTNVAYATLAGALTAEELADNHTVMLLKDVPASTFNGAAIYKSITLDGNNHIIHGSGTTYKGANGVGTDVTSRTGVLVVNGTDASSFTMKNVTIDSATQMGVVVTDGIQRLSIDNCTIICTGTTWPSPVILDRVKLNSNGINNGSIQTEQSGCKITVNDSILKVSSAGSGYALKMYLPVVEDSEIKDSTLAGYACVYNKPGSIGSVLKLNNCQLYSVNTSSGATNEFYMAGTEANDVSYEFENCKMHVAYKDTTNVAYQSLFCLAEYNAAKNLRVYVHGANTIVDNNVTTVYSTINPTGLIKPHVFSATVNKIDNVSTFEIKIEKSLKSQFEDAAVMGSTYDWTEDESNAYVTPNSITGYNIFGVKTLDIGSGTAWYVEPIEASIEAVTAAINDSSIIQIVGGYFDTESPYSIIEGSKPGITPSGYEWVQFDNKNSKNYLGYHLEVSAN